MAEQGNHASRKGPAQTRFWCITLNNPDVTKEEFLESRNKELIDYLVIGDEVGENGTPHFQIFVVFKKRCRFNPAKNYFRPYQPHVESKLEESTVKQAADYCKKDGKWIEFGDVPKESWEKGAEATKRKWEDAYDNAKQGNLDAIDPELKIKYYGTFKRIKADHMKIPDDIDWEDGKPPNEWHWGPTGTGKSRHCRTNNPGFYLKMNNKWWENYDGEETVLIEDVGQSHGWMGDYLKIWADRYGFRGEVKQSSTVIRPKKIIVTSNYTPQELFPTRS
jgi:hypothetical protein